MIDKMELRLLAKFIEKKLKEELIGQGHVASKSLLKSIKVSVEEKLTSTNLVGRFNDYGLKVDTGQKEGTIVPIADLLVWMKHIKIGFKGAQARAFAANVQDSINREGSPTKKSFEFAPNKRRVRWMSRTLDVNENEINRRVEAASLKGFNFFIQNLIEETNKKFKK